MNIKKMTQASVLMALVFVVTRFIQVPIPLGYFNVGNSIILLGCVLLPNPYGTVAASLGSALADLTSFPVYTIPTLIIKALMPIVFYAIKKAGSDNKKMIIATIVSTLIPLFGYTITGMILYGGFAAGIAQFPGLVIEYIANAVIFCLLLAPIKKLGNLLQ